MSKQDPAEKVTSREYLTAKVRWEWFYLASTNNKSFVNFLGITGGFKIGAKPFTIIIRGSAARKIRMLNSPHWRTILMAHEARRHK